jgi:lipoprotein-releasing system permease protein
MRRMQWILFIARRLMRSRRRSRSSVTALLSIFGLAMGVLTLITVISVMNGFQRNTIEDLIELNSFHLRIRPEGRNDLVELLQDLPEVELAAEIIETQALVEGYFSGAQAALIKALDPELFDEGSDYARRLGIEGGVALGDREVILGRELARFLGVQPGDYISVLGLGGESIDIRQPVSIDLEVVELFESGYYEFDRSWGYISLGTAAGELASGYRREIAVKITDRNRDITAIRRIVDSIPGLEGEQIQSWREYNRSIFGALRVEKALMAFLVGLIFLVVGVNMFQGLRRSVHEHLEDIAVIKVLGASDRDVRRVFVIEGVLIGLIGTTFGVILGIAVAGNINGIFASIEMLVNLIQSSADFRIFSPSYFYLESVPSHIIPSEVILIAGVSFLSALISAYGASRRISGLKPREVLNDE